ncbi:protein required for attachment to host cells [Sphingobium wenxiniae]|uniref:Protein required for attachment to host cells n=1 Tax=Sphingobium wenxiniae (strain DSM 21828 / CGMCC 1.7748 / JZ-1) TaxID=595605 RepID=A0A562KGJ7_SPHWJ|nr:host attachment family protein [Sphingobium wenxiniae]MBB6190752.1 protein required for attachment to host cells [Sphingobium wenxiniae]TWH94530.1 protein required for attachment to host cells [Sphingobium wenxiniae]
MRIDHDAMVLVADGRKILLFRNKGDGDFPHLETEVVKEQDNPADRDQASDAPGRAFNSVGGHRSAMEQTDFHDLEESRFAAEAADMLKRRALANEYQKLIVVAPPTALGEMRKHYHKEVQSRLAGEIAKDLSNHPVPEIERIISES